jgi:hypothetical protein
MIVAAFAASHAYIFNPPLNLAYLLNPLRFMLQRQLSLSLRLGLFYIVAWV